MTNIFNTRTNVHYNPFPTPYYHPLPVPVPAIQSPAEIPFYQIQNQYSTYPVYNPFFWYQYTTHLLETSFVPGQYTSDQLEASFLQGQYATDHLDTSFFQNLDDVAVIDDLRELTFFWNGGDEERAQDHALLEEEQIFRREIVHQHLSRKIQQQDSDDDICAICLEEYKAQENIARMKCGHEFHNDCIQEWLFRKDTCPMCKANYY